MENDQAQTPALAVLALMLAGLTLRSAAGA